MTALPFPRGALIVSAQARADNPLHGAAFMAAMALAAEQGGARGIRANGAEDIAAIRAVTGLPIIGIVKRFDLRFPVYITPDLASARAAADAGADMIALDATARPRDGEALETLLPAVRRETGKPVMADIAGLEDALRAEMLGADCVATTLSGYAGDGAPPRGPDLELVAALVRRLTLPVIAEGRYDTPDLVRAAFARGAYAVVVGTAITNPREITRRFAAAAGLK